MSTDKLVDTKIVHFVDDRVETQVLLVPYCRAIGDLFITWDADHVTCRRCLAAFKERVHGN